MPFYVAVFCPFESRQEDLADVLPALPACSRVCMTQPAAINRQPIGNKNNEIVGIKIRSPC
jgi:hypothetical protein